MAATVKPTGNACAFVVGEDGLARWSDLHADAWVGLLETTKRLTRGLDAELETRHGLSLSALEILGRLAAADQRRMRLSAVASATGLSLSRVSRIVDVLERRELVKRVSCPSDARGVEAYLTNDGLALAREAQATHFNSVQKQFFAQLSADELRTLADIFSRFAPRAAAACEVGG